MLCVKGSFIPELKEARWLTVIDMHGDATVKMTNVNQLIALEIIDSHVSNMSLIGNHWLTRLVLQNNDLDSFISCSLGGIDNVTYLDISRNPLTYATISLDCMCDLQFLNLSNTRINMITPQLIKYGSKLKILDISNLPMTLYSFPDVYMFNDFNLSMLFVVQPSICCMVSNEIECIPDVPT